MKSRLIYFSIFVFCVLILSMLVTSVSASPESRYNGNNLRLLLFCDKEFYDVGDDVELTMYVFSDDDLVDADEDFPVLTINPYDYPDDRTIDDITRVDTGIYMSKFTIKESDVGGYYSSSVSLEVEIEYEGEYESETEYLELESLSVFIDVSDTTPEPGDTITITVAVFEGEDEVDPDDIDADLEWVNLASTILDDTYETESITLDFEKDSKGVYSVEYQIDDSIDETTEFTVSVDISNDGNEEYEEMDFAVDFFEVWYHEIKTTSTEAEFELWVADLEGKAVEGAEIDLTYRYYDSTEYRYKTFDEEGTTDQDGKADFTIDYEDDNYIEVYGVVRADEEKQVFQGTVHYEGGDDYYYDDFDVRWEEDVSIEDSIHLPGDKITRTYTAYNDGEEYEEEDIYYYIFTDYEYIDHGKKTTDVDGEFQISFDIPSKTKADSVRIEFVTKIKGYYDSWESDTNYVSITNPGMSISVDKFIVGGKSNVKVEITDGSYLRGYVYCFPYYSTSGGGTTGEWQNWNSDKPFRYFTTTTGSKTIDICMPEFLSKDEQYVIAATAYDNIGESNSYNNYVTLKHGEGASTEPADEEDKKGWFNDPMGLYVGPVPLTLILLIVIIVIILVVFMMVRKKKGAKAKAPKKGMGAPPPPPPPPPPPGYDTTYDTYDTRTAPPPSQQAQYPAYSSAPPPRPRPRAPPPPPAPPQQSSFTCSYCGGYLEFVQEHDSWYCYNCNRYS
ncbi:MAG: hypothetical protein JSV49_02235 [Thermoplasmata archaeon]|nr:MAG: hypothetical protein JSV49_02235 [Thermoplasmata archaeon]